MDFMKHLSGEEQECTLLKNPVRTTGSYKPEAGQLISKDIEMSGIFP